MIVDLSYLKTFTKGNEVKFKRYINLYLEDAPDTFERMRGNIDEENWADLAIYAHSLKPKADFMGIASLKEILVRIEDGVKQEEYGDLKSLYEKALEIHEEAVIVLRKEVAG